MDDRSSAALRAATPIAGARVFDAVAAVRKAAETCYPPLVDRRP